MKKIMNFSMAALVAMGTTFSGLTLTASGKKLSAVYMPDFVCSAAPPMITKTIGGPSAA